jgi:hypothetical protein
MLNLRLSRFDPELSFTDESRVDLQPANSPEGLPESGWHVLFCQTPEASNKLVGFPVRLPANATSLSRRRASLGSLSPGSARKCLFFRAEPTKKSPESPELPATQRFGTGRLGQLGQLFSRSGEQM